MARSGSRRPSRSRRGNCKRYGRVRSGPRKGLCRKQRRPRRRSRSRSRRRSRSRKRCRRVKSGPRKGRCYKKVRRHSRRRSKRKSRSVSSRASPVKKSMTQVAREKARARLVDSSIVKAASRVRSRISGKKKPKKSRSKKRSGRSRTGGRRGRRMPSSYYAAKEEFDRRARASRAERPVESFGGH